MPRPGTHVPVYLHIANELRSRILSGELAPLARTMSEMELAKSFAVSRMTARKAIDRLVGEGLVFRQPGKGTFVARPKIAYRFSSQTSFSAAMDALGLIASTAVLEEGVVVAPTHVATQLGIRPGGYVVFMRRIRCVLDEPAAIHVAYLPARYAAVLDHDLTESLTDIMQREGVEVERARDTVEAAVATGDEARLLRVAPGSPLVRLEGVLYDRANEPVRYTEALYRGDRFRFSVDSAARTDLRLEIKPPAD